MSDQAMSAKHIEVLRSIAAGDERDVTHPKVSAALTAAIAAMGADQWLPIETAPKDGTYIIGWCVHEADAYYDETTDRLTDYGCWAEALGRVPDGPAILEWGGSDSDYDELSGKTIHWPNWWFRVGSDFEQVANPTHWMPLPAPPAQGEQE